MEILLSLSNGSTPGNTVAEYEDDPFGRTIRATGTFADKNPIRFSSQYTDQETGLVYFGFRYYHPQWGRFINRDPIEEAGGENLYRFVSNDPVNRWDHLGQFGFIGGLVGGTVGGVIGDIAGYISSGGDWKAAASGAVGGAVGGAIVGSGVGIVASALAGGTISAGGAIGATAIAGASGGVIGNTAEQYTENRLNGQSPTQALTNINPTEQVTAGAVGALTGSASGAGVVVKQAVNNAIKEGQEAVARHTTQRIAPVIREMASSDDAANKIITRVVGDASEAVAQRVGSTMQTVTAISAVEGVALPAVESAANSMINGTSENSQQSQSGSREDDD